MKKIVFIITIVIFVASPAVASTIFLRGSGGTSPGRTYLVNLDFESSPGWTDSAGTQDCALDTDGDICDQYSSVKHGGSYSFGIYSTTDAYGGKSFTAQSEFYADFWYYAQKGIGQRCATFYSDSTAGTYTLSLYYSNGWKIYQNGGTTLTTGITAVANTWYHVRLYLKRDTDDSNGVIKMWHSSTITDFDGTTPNYSSTATNTQDSDTGYFRLRQAGSTLYKRYYDDVLVWKPDGNE